MANLSAGTTIGGHQAINTGMYPLNYFSTLRLDVTDGDISVIGDVSANIYYGDGSNLTFSEGITFDASTQYIIYLANDTNTGFYWDNTNRYVSLYDDGSEEYRFDIDVGDFHADGNITAYSSSISSDRRLKHNIEKIDPKNALSTVLSLNSVTFNKNHKNDKLNNKIHSGYIAQDVEKTIKHAISENKGMGDDNNFYKYVNYIEVIPYITEGMKAQQEMFDLLKDEMKELKDEMKELKKINK